MDSKLATNYSGVLRSISDTAAACGRNVKEIKLVAVTKNRPIEEVFQLYNAGCREFGESRIQEALPKISSLPQDCRWHMIGTLQKNKALKAVDHFTLIQTVDNIYLAEKISFISREKGCTTGVLLQVNVSGEPSKHGLDPAGWKKAYPLVKDLPGIMVLGLMTMAPLVDNTAVLRSCFAKLRKLRDELPGIGCQLSMGMSNDYKEAIAEGATILRIGSLLFL